MKTLRDIAEEIVQYTSTTARLPPYQVSEVENILKKDFGGNK